jgi:hypothetical protein
VKSPPGTCLGRAGGPPSARHGASSGQVVYLAGLDAVVVPECRDGRRWRCAVIAERTPRLGPGHVTITEGELANAPTTLAGERPADPDLAAMLWQTTVWQHFGHGHTTQVARVLAEQTRRPHTTIVGLSQTDRRRVQQFVRLRTAGLDNILRKLHDAHFLAPAGDQRSHLAILALPPATMCPLCTHNVAAFTQSPIRGGGAADLTQP